MRRRDRRGCSPLSALLYFTFLAGFPLGDTTEWSSSERSIPPASASTPLEIDADIVRDAPLPPLRDNPEEIQDGQDYTGQHERSYNDLETNIEENRVSVTPQESNADNETDDVTKVQRDVMDREKRSSGQQWDKTANINPSPSRRVKTGDTILNIRGAVRDAIGDAGAAPGPRPSTRLDAFVIRPALQHRPQPARAQPRTQPHTGQVPKHDRELLVEPHARAEIICDLVNITNLRWYKDNEQISIPLSSGSGSEAVWRETVGAAGAVVVGRAARGDAGAWRCAGLDDAEKTVSGKPITLLIYEPVRSVYLAVDGRRLDAGNTWVPVRDKTELEVRCVAEGGVPPPELSWRLLALDPTLDHRPYLRIHNTNYSIEGVSSSHAVVTAARELHNATLQCEASQRRPTTPTAPTAPITTASTTRHVLTAKLEIHVTYPPSFVISRWPGFGVALAAGGAAALRCDVDANPPARAWWQRDDADPTSSPPPLEAGSERARGAATLRWPALRASHAGWYRCRATWLDAEYSSIGYFLNVLAPEENAEADTDTEADGDEPDHQKVEVPLGGNVQLHCPKGSVGCWWRRVVLPGNASAPAPAPGEGEGAAGGGGGGAAEEAGEGEGEGAAWAPAGAARAHGVLGIKDALYQEGGEYRCVGARAPDLMRLRELKRVTLRVTGAATATALSAEPAGGGGWRLECGACGRGVRVVWVRRGGALATPATLRPDLAQHCWRAALHVAEPDEVWCAAAGGGGEGEGAGGAVAVFPRRAPYPARHSLRPRPLHNCAAALSLAGVASLVLSAVMAHSGGCG